MGVRQKMKRAFTGRKSGDNSPSDTGTPKIPGIEYYKPGKIPKSKYRGNGDQEHQDKLNAFSFAEAFKFRRSADYSSYSPTGTRSQSRRASHLSRKSKMSDVDHNSLRRKSTNPARIGEATEDDANAKTVGLSRPATSDGNRDKAPSPTAENALQHETTITENDTPFSATELERAMTATKLHNEA